MTDNSKITITLSLAFGLEDDEFIFPVLVNNSEYKNLSKQEINQLSLDENVNIIDLDRRDQTRRWRDRVFAKEKDRRQNK